MLQLTHIHTRCNSSGGTEVSGRVVRFASVDRALLISRLSDFSSLLLRNVRDGASLGWEKTLTLDEARDYWETGVAPILDKTNRFMIGAFDGDDLAGCVQIERAHFPMSRHRAEVLKLIVDPVRRRQGIGRGLMLAAEAAAMDAGIELFVLDTRPGVAAEHLYARMGYSKTGFIPNCLRGADGSYQHTVYYYKQLSPEVCARNVVQLEHD